MTRLVEIQLSVQERTDSVTAAHADWPCHAGCDECCRRLASVPRVSDVEWRAIADAIAALPPDVARLARERMRASSTATRPVTCPLLDLHTGRCLIYAARPVLCRTYGFYAERDKVLGCERVVEAGQLMDDVVWGNHVALEQELATLGATREFFAWLRDDEPA